MTFFKEKKPHWILRRTVFQLNEGECNMNENPKWKYLKFIQGISSSSVAGGYIFYFIYCFFSFIIHTLNFYKYLNFPLLRIYLTVKDKKTSPVMWLFLFLHAGVISILFRPHTLMMKMLNFSIYLILIIQYIYFFKPPIFSVASS